MLSSLVAGVQILQKCHLTIIAFHFMYGVDRLQQRTTCVFYQFQIYDNIGEKGGAGGLKLFVTDRVWSEDKCDSVRF